MGITNLIYTVQPLQTPLDICLESAGVIDGVFVFANLIRIGITDELSPGDDVIGLIPDPDKQSIVNIFLNSPPASGLTVNQSAPSGIGNMQIESNFIVS